MERTNFWFLVFPHKFYKAEKKVFMNKRVRLQNSLGSTRRNTSISGTCDVLPHHLMYHYKSGNFHLRYIFILYFIVS